MTSLLEHIPGASDVMNRWFAYGNDAGIMFVDSAFVTLGDGDNKYDIKLPVSIALTARKKVVTRENDGLVEPITFVTRCVTTDLTLSGRAANWRKTTLPPIPIVPAVGGIVGGVAGVASTLIGTEPLIDKVKMLADLYGLLRKVDEPVRIVDKEGLLGEKGIEYVNLADFREMPEGCQVAWTMRCVVDSDISPMELIFSQEAGQK
jgi:hypothetical protein